MGADSGGHSVVARRTRRGAVTLLALALAAVLAGCAGDGGDDEGPGVSLILKTQTNPFFVAMRDAAREEARAGGTRLSVAAGTADGDTQNQINAIYTAIARGDEGILITSNGPAVNAALRLAEEYGLYVIALDTPLDPVETADLTYATDNFAAGRLIGEYAAARLDGEKAVIAMLDLYDDQVVSVDVERDTGFLDGMGIEVPDKRVYGSEEPTGRYAAGRGGDYEIVCHEATQGAIDGGRQAMEQCLSRNPEVNVVYTINEPAGEGAYAALRAEGRERDAFIVTIDGSCGGLESVREGVFAADATQYPGKMAQLGVESVAEIGAGGEAPELPDGESFVDTGTNLVTAEPIDGVESQSVDQGLEECWG